MYFLYLSMCFLKGIEMTIFILIAGGTSSGKSTICDAVEEAFDCTMMHGDNYYFPKDIFEEKKVPHFDCVEAFDVDLLKENIELLAEGKKAFEPKYSMKLSDRTEKLTVLKPAPLVIIEGILVLAMKEIREFCRRSFFVNVDLDEMLRRRMLRDTLPEEEGGRGKTVQEVADEWPAVKKGHLSYVRPTREFASMVIDNSYLVNGKPKAIPEILGVIQTWMNMTEIIQSEIQNGVH